MNKKRCRSEKSTMVRTAWRCWDLLHLISTGTENACFHLSQREMMGLLQLTKGKVIFIVSSSAPAEPLQDILMSWSQSQALLRDPLQELHNYRLLIVYSINKSQLTHVFKVISDYSGSNKGDLNGYYIVINFRAIFNCLSGIKEIWV